MTKVAIIIQKWWKGYKARKNYSKGCKLYEELKQRKEKNEKYKKSKLNTV